MFENKIDKDIHVFTYNETLTRQSNNIDKFEYIVQMKIEYTYIFLSTYLKLFHSSGTKENISK